MKLMILDGNSIANRAFFGIRMLNAPDGTPTNAVFGFLNILHKLVNVYKPDALCASFDLHAPTFRHEANADYKANRKPMPEDLRVQMPIIKDIIGKMGINIYEMEGYEADDVLGTVSKKCEDDDVECIVVTGDRDSLQLVSEYTSVCLLKNTEDILYTPEKFYEDYGFAPKGMIDLKALMGDSSDNIPGVPGVGEKTAMSLIQKYHNLDNILSDIDSLDIKEGMKNKLRSGQESARTSYWLATIFRDVPLNFTVDNNNWNREFDPGLFDTLSKLGLYKIIDKWKVKKPESTDDNLASSVIEHDDIPDGLTVTDDVKTLYKQGFDGFAFDTTIAQYLLNPTAKDYRQTASYIRLNNQLEEYGLKDLYYSVELPLAKVLAKMELAGIATDKNALEAFSAQLGERIESLQSNIFFQAGKEFNINSPKQLGEVLFNDLMLPDLKKGSTAADVLQGLRILNPIIDDILEYRELSKLKSTYTDGLQDYIADDGRIHTTFQQTVTATGRLSSTDPNLQNIPIRKELGSELRKMFVASPGNVLVDADYSQIELRLLASISNDDAMIDSFNSGEDFHAVTASKVFNVPLSGITPLLRSRAKAVNFGIIYGISAFSLGNDIGVTPKEAKAYMEAYFARFEGVRKYMDDIRARAYENGYVTTLYGRRRDIPELRSSNFNTRQFGERVALNAPIQGTAADIIKMAMIAVDNALENLNARLLLQVHDELVVECPEEEAEQVRTVLKDCMEGVAKLRVPLIVETGIGKNWGEAH